MNKWVTRLFIITCIALILGALFRLLTPQSPPIPQTTSSHQNFDGSFSTFQNITFAGDEPSLPNQLSVVTLDSEITTEVLAAELTTNFGLSADPNLPNYYSGSEYNLSQSSPHELTLAQNGQNTSSTIVDLSLAKASAESFVKQVLPTLSFTVQENQLRYYKTEGFHYEDTPPEGATLVVIPLAQTVDGIPIFQTGSAAFPISLWIDGQGVVTKAVFTPPFYVLGATNTTHQPISINNAMNNINQSQASIVSSTQTEFGPLDLGQIAAGKLTTAALEYRIDPDLMIAYPFYRFTGTVVNSRRTTLEVQIITPAVVTSTQ